MTGWHVLVLLAAGLAAGAVNAVAGGGTLLTFPALLATGLSPVSANVTNTVAVWPGYLSSAVAFRGRWEDTRTLVRLSVAAALGGVVGTVVLLNTPAKVFEALVPWLVFAATGLIAAQPEISRRMAARRTVPVGPDHVSPFLPVAIFGAAVYGAYFGGGLGIVILAVLALGIPIDLGRLNALKSYLQLTVNTVALDRLRTVRTGELDCGADRRAGELCRRHRGGQDCPTPQPQGAPDLDRGVRRGCRAAAAAQVTRHGPAPYGCCSDPYELRACVPATHTLRAKGHRCCGERLPWYQAK